jgi:hypothetical protein
MDKQEEWRTKLDKLTVLPNNNPFEDPVIVAHKQHLIGFIEETISSLRSKDRDTLIEKIRGKQYVITEEYDGEKMVKIQPNYAVNSVLEDVKQIILETMK